TGIFMNNLSIVIITGLSGAGKSHTAKVFEDLGYYTIDNVPLPILEKVVELFYSLDNGITKVAFVIDSRAKDINLVYQFIKMLKETYNATSIFMDASSETLIKRYKETRRKHPLGSDVPESIKKEITLMGNVKDISDIVLNTDNKSIHDLTKEIVSIFAMHANDFIVTLQSFGFKNGVPNDADMMFDVRFMRNPHFDDGLRTMTGLNEEVQEYVKADESYYKFMEKLTDMVKMLIPLYVKEGKKYFNISIGCTGGKHRSVTVVENLAASLSDSSCNIRIKHRDIEK
ncbi:MAG: RNase adapter RapZ, partial [Bacilli bacterium]